MARTGRPPLPEDQRKKSVTIRLRQEDYELLKKHGGPVKLIEEVLIPTLMAASLLSGCAIQKPAPTSFAVVWDRAENNSQEAFDKDRSACYVEDRTLSAQDDMRVYTSYRTNPILVDYGSALNQNYKRKCLLGQGWKPTVSIPCQMNLDESQAKYNKDTNFCQFRY